MPYDENALRHETRVYWSNRSPSKIKIEREYIPHLLDQELACARQRGAIEATLCDTLVLLVGYSLEPLLQAVCVFQPRKQIVLVLNETYSSPGDGESYGDEAMDLIGQLPERLIDRQPFQPFNTDDFLVRQTADQPAAVFHLLQENLKTYVEQRQRVIIDITGAKKSMVAGAFLYASYTNTPISYVDFEEYDPQESRPYGYTCRIGLLRDPYETFRLRDWERVRQLYQSCQFRAAREIVQGQAGFRGQSRPGLVQWMAQEAAGQRYFTPDQVQTTERLAAILEVYELWDNGDFYQARENAAALSAAQVPFEAPLAVRTLGPFWPHADQQGGPHKAASQLLNELKSIETGPHSLPATAHHFTIYARDEIAKISRLILFNEDYRSTLLRAVGLGESLLKARWVSLWLMNQVEVAMQPQGCYTPRAELPLDIQEELRQELWKAFRANQLMHGLRYTDNKDYQDRASRFERQGDPEEREPPRYFYVRRMLTAPRIESRFLFGQLQDLRNKAIHTYLSVPKNVAEEALSIARASLKDYEQQWVNHLDATLADKAGTTCNTDALLQGQLCQLCGPRGLGCDYWPLPWEQVTKRCGIDFLPPVPND